MLPVLVRSSVPINDEKGEVMSTLHGCKKQDEDGAQSVARTNFLAVRKYTLIEL